MQPASRAPTFRRPGDAYPGAPPNLPPAPGPASNAPFTPAPSGPLKTNPWAITSLVCALLPLLLFPLGTGIVGENDVVGMLSVVLLPGPILAIIFGAIALHQIKREPHVYGGRGLAMAGLIMGIVEIVMAILMIILMLLVIWTVMTACASAGAACSTAQMATIGHDRATRRAASRWGGIIEFATAHHPDCAHFDADVLRWNGLRLCVSCATMACAVLATSFVLALLPPIDPATLLIGGLALGSFELLARAGLTRTRALKVGVKILFGVGLALVAHGVVFAPWLLGIKVAVFVAIAGIAFLLTQARAHSLDRACAMADRAWPRQ